MVVVQELAYKNEHEYFFEFKGQQYRVHSVVKLTEKGRVYLGFARREVILTEVYYYPSGRKMWKYQGKDIKYNVGIQNKSTDTLPDEIIEEVITPASAEYASREMLGRESSFYQVNGTKHTKKDWEIPELKRAWIVFIVFFVAVSIFQDLILQTILRLIAVWIFSIRRQAYIEAYTTYTHDEDSDIIKHKYHALYGFKINREDDNNE